MRGAARVVAPGSAKRPANWTPIANGRRRRSPRDRSDRLMDAKRRLEQELAVDAQVTAIYEDFHAHGRDSLGRRVGRQPKPRVLPVLPEGMVNLTDPDSRLVHDKRMSKLQGYNAQAAVSCDGQIIVAAEISTRSPDFGHLDRSLTPRCASLSASASASGPRRCWLTAGYWHSEQTDQIVAAGTQVLIPPQSRTRDDPAAGMGYRALRVYARGAGQPGRQRALSPARAVDRADLRADQTQPRVPTVPTTRHEPPPARNGG